MGERLDPDVGLGVSVLGEQGATDADNAGVDALTDGLAEVHFSAGKTHAAETGQTVTIVSENRPSKGAAGQMSFFRHGKILNRSLASIATLGLDMGRHFDISCNACGTEYHSQEIPLGQIDQMHEMWQHRCTQPRHYCEARSYISTPHGRALAWMTTRANLRPRIR